MPENETPTTAPETRVRFGPFEFDPNSLELRRSGRAVHLPPKPARVLAVLLSRPGRIVTREEISAAVWPDAVLDIDSALNTCVRQVRAALGDRGDASLYIETLPRRGYRFLPEVTPITDDDASTPPAAGASRLRPFHAAPWARWRVLGAVAVIAVALAVGVVGLHRVAESSAERRSSLLVMPVEDLSASDTAPLFAEGLTEDIIASLARLQPERLDVIALTSALRLESVGGEDPASALDVDYVLEASVRREGERTRVVAQLVRAADGVHLWADSYDRSYTSVLDLQRDIAGLVARALSLRLTPGVVAPAHEVASSVRLPYLEGRHLLRSMDRSAWKRARDRFEDVVTADPDFAPGHAHLAEALMRMGEHERAERAVERALALDPDLAQAHHVRGHILMVDAWDFAGAERALRRAIELAPGQPEHYQGLAYLLTVLGRHDEAIAQIERAAELDPLSPYVTGDAGLIYYWARRYDDAIAYCAKTLELDPSAGWADECILNASVQVGDWSVAGAKARELLGRTTEHGDDVPAPADSSATAQVTAFRRWQADWLERASREGRHHAYASALVYADLGAPDRALDELERAAGERSLVLISLAVEPRFDPIRERPRYQALLTRMGLR